MDCTVGRYMSGLFRFWHEKGPHRHIRVDLKNSDGRENALCQSIFLLFLKGDPLIAIFQIDRTADPIAVFDQRFLHGDIIPVGINADITALSKAPCQAKTGNSPGSGC